MNTAYRSKFNRSSKRNQTFLYAFKEKEDLNAWYNPSNDVCLCFNGQYHLALSIFFPLLYKCISQLSFAKDYNGINSHNLHLFLNCGTKIIEPHDFVPFNPVW